MLIFDQLKKNDPQLRALTLAVLAGFVVLAAGLWWVQIVSAREYQQNLETQSFRTVRIPAVRGKILDRNGAVLAENRPSYNVGLYLDDVHLRRAFQRAYLADLARTRAWMVRMEHQEERRLGRTLSRQERRGFLLTVAQRAAIQDQSRYWVASNVVLQISRELREPLSLDFNRFEKHCQRSLALPFQVVDDIDPTLVARFEEQSTSPMGADLEVESLRYYPLRTLAAHLLGHLERDDSSAEGEEAYFTYRLADYRGVVGVECACDPELRGHAGGKSVLVNSQGYRQAENVWEPAEPGRNVVLTIDLRIQEAAERALEAVQVNGIPHGAAVVMDVHSGDILAMASVPEFDPNSYVVGFRPGEFQQMEASGAEKNRATQENYQPGSIFKPVVGMACLENGMNPNALYQVQPYPGDPRHGCVFVGRRKIRDLAPPGEYDFKRALMHSSNAYFIANGLRYAGIQKIVEIGRHLHFGETADLGTRQETPGIFPSDRRIRSRWTDGDTANLCIGQGDIAVTPLQMTVLAAAIANGGKVLWPRLVRRIEPQDPLSGEAPRVFPSGRVRDQLPVHPRTLQIIREAMLGDTEDPEGTAYAQFRGSPLNQSLRVCGKTGTAQVMNIHNQEIGRTTWFMSFAPYEHPRYAVVVMVENGNYGGPTCAPVARKIYETILKIEQSKPGQTVAAR